MLRLHGHNVAPQENLIGNEYVIDLKLKVDISLRTTDNQQTHQKKQTPTDDEVADATVNYAEVRQCDKNRNGDSFQIAGTMRMPVAESYKNFSRHFLILRNQWSLLKVF